MPQKEFETAYPPIDADPHFRRVVRYFRPSDYYAMAGATVAFPGALYLLENSDPARGKGKLGAALKFSAFLGLCGGFLYAYQRSTFRFWGWSENEREQSMAQAEAASGNVIGQGKSTLTKEMQGAAYRNSIFSQLNLAVLPWFNLVDHEYHGTQKTQ
ncbi:hypothetical protein MEQU1_003302 [Malassezia equina]|uniref:NADH-ubiquinone oxidoreductase 21 kDa subunit n=1 Tax=Malassezia equina TaxID=1381935 RepID=A0AAF0EH52_9BASI|nr:hypothetical protein MEQU1_003302 [Malassezia equina]